VSVFLAPATQHISECASHPEQATSQKEIPSVFSEISGMTTLVRILLWHICSKARTMEPEKQPLLTNGYETFVSMQQLGKHVPAETDTHATIEVLLETVFSTRSL
jgi:hypothetical protein